MSFEQPAPPASETIASPEKPKYAQRTIASFLQEFGVTEESKVMVLLDRLTHVVYGYNRSIILLENEQDPDRKDQIQREIQEIYDKINRTIRAVIAGNDSTEELYAP